jgi:hypothetical protein
MFYLMKEIVNLANNDVDEFQQIHFPTAVKRKYQAWKKEHGTSIIPRPVSIMCLKSRITPNRPFQRGQHRFFCDIFILAQLDTRNLQLRGIRSSESATRRSWASIPWRRPALASAPSLRGGGAAAIPPPPVVARRRRMYLRLRGDGKGDFQVLFYSFYFSNREFSHIIIFGLVWL